MKKTITTFMLLIASAIIFQSCDAFKPIDISGDGGMDLINKQVDKYWSEAKDLDVYRVTFNGKEALNNEIGSISLLFKEGSDIEGKTLYLENTGRMMEIAIKNPTEKLEERTPKKYSEFDFSNIQNNIEKAKELVATEDANLEFEAVAKYVIYSSPVDGGTLDNFALQFTDKTEGTKVEGKNLVTDYYEINFDINENGEVILREE